ncbi:ArsR/SmtB family transcription factor [Singulisphaera acidiphila]|nr:metalloregulator ArsR/SmtB family transcription factor [Singulisphaera acidiphila]
MKETTTDALDASPRLLKPFADPIRLNLLSGDREVCVCHLPEALGLLLPTVSRHLTYMRKHGLVVGRKEGLWGYCRLARPKSDRHRALIGCVGNCMGETEGFLQDGQRLARIVPCYRAREFFSATIFASPHILGRRRGKTSWTLATWRRSSCGMPRSARTSRQSWVASAGALVLDKYVTRLTWAGFRADRHTDAVRKMIEVSGIAPPLGAEKLMSVNITATKQERILT